MYPYIQLGERYLFTTVQDVAVTVHLPLDGRWFPNNPEIANVHSFFLLTDKPSMGLDVRLRDTVLDILTSFFKEVNAIIVFHCDPFDGKGNQRHAKFSRWFSLIDDASVEKHDRQAIVTDLTLDEIGNLVRTEYAIYASILLRKSHAHYTSALDLFHSGDLDKSGKL